MIHFENIHKSYGDKTIIDNLNLTIEKSEFFILLGESGCGKSTTLNMINKLILPDRGNIYINNVNINKINVLNLRRSIGYSVQSTALFPHMTVYDNIALIPKLMKWNKKKVNERVTELLKLMELDFDLFANKYPSQLSGGQAQRVGIARSISAKPSILLMDEPFSALDPITRNNLQNLFKSIHKKIESTVIFVTHDISEAIKMGQRIAVMKDGKIIDSGTPEKILLDNKNELTKRFLGIDSYIDILERYKAVNYMIKPNSNSNVSINEKATLKICLASMIRNCSDSINIKNEKGIITGMINFDIIKNVLQGENQR